MTDKTDTSSDRGQDDDVYDRTSWSGCSSSYKINEEGAQRLLMIAGEAEDHELWSSYAAYCRLRAKGSRKSAFENLHVFMKQMQARSGVERREFVQWLCETLQRIDDVRCGLIPDPLPEELVLPVLREWAAQEPQNMLPLRLLGEIFYDSQCVDRALKLDPEAQWPRMQLGPIFVGRFEHATHHLPEYYIGNPAKDVSYIPIAYEHISHLTDTEQAQSLRRSLRYYEQMIKDWLAFRVSSEKEFSVWCRKHNRSYSWVPSFGGEDSGSDDSAASMAEDPKVTLAKEERDRETEEWWQRWTSDAASRVNLAMRLSAEGRRAEAVAAFRKAIELRPRFAEAYGKLGSELNKTGRYDEAVPVLQRGIELDPDSFENYVALLQALVMQGRVEQGIAVLRKAPGRESPDPSVMCSLMDALRRAVEINPEIAGAWFCLGSQLARMGEHSEAISALLKAAGLDPGDAEVCLLLANCLMERGRCDEAIEHYRRAAELDSPLVYEAHNELGWALNQIGSWDEAVPVLRKAIKLKPECAPAQTNLAWALERQGKFDEALEFYGKAIDVSHSKENYVMLGRALEKRGKHEEAMKCYLAAVRSNPGSAWAHAELGGAELRQGNLDEAIRRLRFAIKMDPAARAPYGVLGAILVRQGKYEEARPMLRRAIELDPGNASVRTNLDRCTAHLATSKSREGAGPCVSSGGAKAPRLLRGTKGDKTEEEILRLLSESAAETMILDEDRRAGYCDVFAYSQERLEQIIVQDDYPGHRIVPCSVDRVEVVPTRVQDDFGRVIVDIEGRKILLMSQQSAGEGETLFSVLYTLCEYCLAFLPDGREEAFRQALLSYYLENPGEGDAPGFLEMRRFAEEQGGLLPVIDKQLEGSCVCPLDRAGQEFGNKVREYGIRAVIECDDKCEPDIMLKVRPGAEAAEVARHWTTICRYVTRVCPGVNRVRLRLDRVAFDGISIHTLVVTPICAEPTGEADNA